MSAVIDDLQRKREREIMAQMAARATAKSAIELMLEAFELAQVAIATGGVDAVRRARHDFILVRADVAADVERMPAMPLRRLAAGFIQVSHAWSEMSANTPIGRARAGVVLEGLALLLRDEL